MARTFIKAQLICFCYILGVALIQLPDLVDKISEYIKKYTNGPQEPNSVQVNTHL